MSRFVLHFSQGEVGYVRFKTSVGQFRSTPLFANVSANNGRIWAPEPETLPQPLTSTSPRRERALLWSKESTTILIEASAESQRPRWSGSVGERVASWVICTSLLNMCRFQSSIWCLINSARLCQTAFSTFYNRKDPQLKAKCLNWVFA